MQTQSDSTVMLGKISPSCEMSSNLNRLLKLQNVPIKWPDGDAIIQISCNRKCSKTMKCSLLHHLSQILGRKYEREASSRVSRQFCIRDHTKKQVLWSNNEHLSEAELFAIYLDIKPGVWPSLVKHSEDSTSDCSFLFSRARIKADLKIQYSYHSFFF